MPFCFCGKLDRDLSVIDVCVKLALPVCETQFQNTMPEQHLNLSGFSLNFIFRLLFITAI